jgi:hypothetical protein
VHPPSDFLVRENLLAGPHREFLGAVIPLEDGLGIEKGEGHPTFPGIGARAPEPIRVSRVFAENGELLAG